MDQWFRKLLVGFENYVANPDLKWETTVTRNAGIDFSLFNSKLNGSIEGYWNSTVDLLINFPIPEQDMIRNTAIWAKHVTVVSNCRSTGWPSIRKILGLNFSGNIGFNHNKIMSLGLMDDFGASSGWASTEIGVDYWIATGGSVGQMYGYVSDGRYEVSDFKEYNATTKKWILNDGVADASGVVGALRPGK